MSDGCGTRYIRPCPFCGSGADVIRPDDESLAWTDYEVACRGQMCFARVIGNSFDDAIDSWNRRE